jgi:hypothetical protein
VTTQTGASAQAPVTTQTQTGAGARIPVTAAERTVIEPEYAGGAEADSAGPEGGDAAGRRRRRAVLVGLVLVLLAGVAAVLVPVLRPDGQRPEATGRPGTGAPAATVGPGSTTGPSTARSSGPASPGTRSTPSSRATNSVPRRTSPPGPATGRDVPVPAGFTRYTDPQDGFSLIIPAGWRPLRRDTRVDFNDPASGRFLRIDTSDTPLADPYQNWIDYESQFSQGKVDYQNLGIHRVPSYRPEEGWSTADWEFTLGGTHVLDRNIRVSDVRAHAIYWSTPESLWDSASSRRILQLAEQSFVPAPPGR